MDSLVGRLAPWTALWGGQLRGQPCGEAGFVDSLVGRQAPSGQPCGEVDSMDSLVGRPALWTAL